LLGSFLLVALGLAASLKKLFQEGQGTACDPNPKPDATILIIDLLAKSPSLCHFGWLSIPAKARICQPSTGYDPTDSPKMFSDLCEAHGPFFVHFASFFN
jgi:hypothetical protein